MLRRRLTRIGLGIDRLQSHLQHVGSHRFAVHPHPFFSEQMGQPPRAQAGIVSKEFIPPMLDRHLPRIGGAGHIIQTGAAQRQQSGLLRQRQLSVRPLNEPHPLGPPQDRGQIFFQPGHLGAEPTDLGIEFFELLLMCRLLGSPFAFALKERGQPLERGGFPGADLVGVNAVLGSNLSDGFLFFERFGDDFGFESGGNAVFSWHFQSNLFLPLFVSKFPGPL